MHLHGYINDHGAWSRALSGVWEHAQLEDHNVHARVQVCSEIAKASLGEWYHQWLQHSQLPSWCMVKGTRAGYGVCKA
jgi:hypothetical protein